MKVDWSPMPAGPTTHMTASWPTKASVRAEKLYPVRMRGTSSRCLVTESSLVIIVTSKPALVRAAVMGVPKFPEA